MNWRRMLLALWLCQPACQAELPLTTPASATAAVSDISGDSNRELQVLLASVQRGEPVLGALSPEQRAAFDELLATLSETEIDALRSLEGAIVLERPILHLMAGGRSQMALYSLATTPSAANELVGIQPDNNALAEVLETTNEVIRRAALEWLSSARERVEQGPALDVDFCEELDQVAGVLNLKKLRFAARSLWTKLDDSPAARLNLARSALWIGEYEQAKDELDKVRQEQQSEPMIRRFMTQIEQLLATADLLSKPAKNLGEAVSHARGHLLMADHKAAKSALAPYAGERAQHLALATTFLIAEFPNLPCSGVVAGLGNSSLCAFANRRGPLASHDFKLLQQAWESGRGRTAQSVEDYLGLALIIPWRSQLDNWSDSKRIILHGRELAKAAEAAEKQFQGFSGLALIGRAMVAGLTSGDKAADSNSSSSLDALESETRQLVKTASGSQRDTAAALAAVLVLAQHRDARELYRQLPRPSGLDHALQQVVLGAWLAAAFRDAALFEEVKARAIEVLSAMDTRALESSELVLLLAEAATLVDPNEGNRRTLQQVSQELAEVKVPRRLAFRALLHRAHLLSEQAKSDAAAALLRDQVQHLTDLRGASALEPIELLMRARLSLYETRSESPAVRLDQWRRVFGERDWPPSIDSWRRRWEAEFRFQGTLAGCQNRAACVQQARRTRASEMLTAQQQLGATSRRLADLGVVSLGSLEISIDYQPLAGLRAVVRSDPALIVLPHPQKDANQIATL